MTSGVGLLWLCVVPPPLQTVAFSTNDRVLPRPRNGRRLTVASMAWTTSASGADLLPEIRDEIEARGKGQLQTWEESVRIVADRFPGPGASDDDDEAELCLADAFRWKAWASASAMARRYQKPTLPDGDRLREGLDWLRDGPLEMTDEQVRNNIRRYPGIYLREPDALYGKVMRSAPKKYRDDAVLKQLIEMDPNILQVTFNCEEEGCQSECGSCWVTYENRLPSIPNL